ncbi:MAG: hypothetical protein BGO01_13015 [Armatimonadetes bacterium 55-13]|nr:hypothetical protein [Armatimonadota bacterium]OJU61830.1 MAG: hypothetical protein BGO01_13015 [Armatimonadetes bacterium 55-13]
MNYLIAALMVAGTMQGKDTSPHSEAQLVAVSSRVQPGGEILAAVRIKMEPGWHCYWRNPGDSGMATAIDWKLPAGWKASPLMWPVPHVLDADGFTVYGFEDEALFLAKITAPKTAKAGASYRLGAEANWLICKDSCVPAKEATSLVVQIGKPVPSKTWATRLRVAYEAQPEKAKGWNIAATLKNKSISLKLGTPPGIKLDPNVRFIAADPETIAHSAEQVLEGAGSSYTLRIPESEFASKAPTRLRGLLIGLEGGTAVEIDVPIATSL